MADTFKNDVELLKKYTDPIVLSSSDSKAQIVVVPKLQGRVMTSTVDPDGATNFGWINKELFESGQPQPQIHAYGGEDRFWIGPEGGQFSIFFESGKPFDFEYWKTPALIDTQVFDLVASNSDRCEFQKKAQLKNYSGTEFEIQIDRSVSLLNRQDIEKKINCQIPDDLKLVGYQTENSITNTADKPWSKKTGLLSIWILGMFDSSDNTTIVIPFKAGPADQLGAKVKDDYFGQVPDERLVVSDDVLFFKADSKYRSKIGISPSRAKPLLGSYDADNNALTIACYNQPQGITEYVNSSWEFQKEPFKGDVVNAYNDGEPTKGEKQLGLFYELETSSPAVELKSGEKITHTHSTMHITGSKDQLDKIAQSVFGVSLEKIENAFE